MDTSIKAILESEEQAKAVAEQARAEAERIVADARRESLSVLTAGEAKAREERERLIAEQRERLEGRKRQLLASQQKDVDAMAAKAKRNTDAAVSFIVDRIKNA